MEDMRQIGCMVSVGERWTPGGKTIAVGTSKKVMTRMKTTFRRLGVKVTSHARHLGVDYAPGS